MNSVAPVLGKLAAALAEDTGPGRRAASEMVAAAAIRSISAPRAEAQLEHDVMKRTVQGLLNRARGADYTRGAENALFRLPAADRSALVLAHAAKWTYAEIGDALGIETDGAERLIWAARLGLAAEKAQVHGAKHWAYPIGGSRADASCPEYDTARPWTQRFLDRRFATRMEEIFLENHVRSCASCHRTLQLARRVYYDAEGSVLELDREGFWEMALGRIWAARTEFVPASERSMRDLLWRWVKREETIKLIFLLGLLVLAAIVAQRA